MQKANIVKNKNRSTFWIKIKRFYLHPDVLYDKICIVTPTAISMKNALNAQCSATHIAQYSNVNHRVVMEMTLTCRGIDLCTVKFFMYLPKRGWFINQSYRFLLPRRNRKAANSNKGVVGSIGRNIPKMASPRDISPNIVNNAFTYFLITPSLNFMRCTFLPSSSRIQDENARCPSSRTISRAPGRKLLYVVSSPEKRP